MAELDAISSRQAGVVTRAQALAAGLTVGAVRFRLRSGRWQRLAPGTYATFTGEVPRAARRWAAVLSAGEGAALSHRSAAEEFRLVPAEAGGPIHLTIPESRRVAAQPGTVVHRCAHIAERRHPTRLPPQTRVEETVLDLAIGAGTRDEAMAWMASACARRLTSPARLARALGRRRWVIARGELARLLEEVASDGGVHARASTPMGYTMGAWTR